MAFLRAEYRDPGTLHSYISHWQDNERGIINLRAAGSVLGQARQ